MEQAQTHKDSDGQLWYSPEHMENQIINSYHIGVIDGIRVNFHAMVPYDNEALISLESEFWKRVNNEYNKMLEKSHARRYLTGLNRD